MNNSNKFRKQLIIYLVFAVVFIASCFTIYYHWVNFDSEKQQSLPNTLTQYEIAYQYFTDGQYKKAIKEFEDAKKDFPVKSLYMRGRCYKELLDPVINWEKLFITKLDCLDRNYQDYYISAITFYDEVYKKFPTHKIADDALGMSAALDFRVGKFNDAAKKYLLLLGEYPFSDIQSRFRDTKLILIIMGLESIGKFNYFNKILSQDEINALINVQFNTIPNNPNLLILIDKYLSFKEDLYLIKQFNLLNQYLDKKVINNQGFLLEAAEEACSKGDDISCEKLRSKLRSWYHPFVDYKKALTMLQQGKISNAEKYFKIWLEYYEYQNHPLTLHVLYFYAESLFRQKKYNDFIIVGNSYLLKYEENISFSFDGLLNVNNIDFKKQLKSINIHTFSMLDFPILTDFFNGNEDYQFYLMKKRIFHVMKELKLKQQTLTNLDSIYIKLIIEEFNLANALYSGDFLKFKKLHENFMQLSRNYRVSMKFREEYINYISPYVDLSQIIFFLNNVDNNGNKNFDSKAIENYKNDLRNEFIEYEDWCSKLNYTLSPYTSTKPSELREKIINKLSSSKFIFEISKKENLESFLQMAWEYSMAVHRKEGLIIDFPINNILNENYLKDKLANLYFSIHPKYIKNKLLKKALFLFAAVQAKESQNSYITEALLLHYTMRKIPSTQIKNRIIKLIENERKKTNFKSIRVICDTLTAHLNEH